MHPSPDVLALLALGEEAGTPDERAHIESCAECQAEIAGLARAVAAGRGGRAGNTGLVSPPDHVWHAVQAELGFATDTGSARSPEVSTVPESRPAGVETNGAAPGEDPEQVESLAARTDRPSADPGRGAAVTNIADARARSSRGRRSLAALVAAAVALVLGIGLGFGLDRFLTPGETVLWTAQLQALPDFAGSSGEAKVEADREGNRMLVVELDSPEPVDGARAVWLIDPDVKQMRMLGWLNDNKGSWPVPPDLDPRRFPIVDVSEEPPGDPDTRHSGVSIVRGTLNV
jgi:anti-sigma-K factor RskA